MSTMSGSDPPLGRGGVWRTVLVRTRVLHAPKLLWSASIRWCIERCIMAHGRWVWTSKISDHTDVDRPWCLLIHRCTPLRTDSRRDGSAVASGHEFSVHKPAVAEAHRIRVGSRVVLRPCTSTASVTSAAKGDLLDAVQLCGRMKTNPQRQKRWKCTCGYTQVPCG